MNDTAPNPLLSEWTTPYGVPPFDRIRIEDYRPAVERLIADSRQAIERIATQPEKPTFGNTIEALEFAQQPLERVTTLFYNLNSAETDDAMQALALELSPLLTAYSNDVMLDERLFGRVKTVYDAAAGKGFEGLSAEQQMLLEETYRSFVRSGANLDEELKARYRAVTDELARLTLHFEQNLLAATNAFRLHLTTPDETAGVPEAVLDAAA